MTNSCTRPVSVGYSDHRVSDWEVREAGRPVCGHGAPVGTGRPYPGTPRTHRAAVLRRVGHQEGSSARIRRYCRVSSPGQKGDLASQVTATERFCLARDLRVDEWLTEIGGGMDLTRRTFAAVLDRIERGPTSTPG